MVTLNSHQLRDIDLHDASVYKDGLERRQLYFILDNVYDTYNIGGLFRLADALAVSGIYLCGDTETPPNHKIMKASVGTYKIVPWVYKKNAIEAIQDLREKNEKINIIAVEQSKKSVSYTQTQYALPCALVLGNESFGVSEETLACCNSVVEIPMWGVNKSLNVIVSAAIVGYEIIRQNTANHRH